MSLGIPPCGADRDDGARIGRRLGYLSGAPMVSTHPDRTGPRSHVVGIMSAFAALGWDVHPFIVGDHVPQGLAHRRGPLLTKSRAAVLLTDLGRLAARPVQARHALRSLGGRVDWVYERFANFQALGVPFRAMGVPWILETNAPLYREAKAERRSVVLSGVARRLEFGAYQACDVLVCVSEALRQIVLEEARVSPDKVLVIPNGVDTALFDPDRYAPRRHSDGFTIVYVGTLSGWQGIDLLLRAIHEVRESAAIRIHALVVGDGRMRARCEQMARELELGEQVRFAGQVPQREVPALIAGADIGYAGHFDASGQEVYHSPLKLYEYLAMGKPVLASAVGDARRLARGGVGGFLFQPGHLEDLVAALRRAHAARDDLPRLGRRARADVVASHSWIARTRDIIAGTERILEARRADDRAAPTAAGADGPTRDATPGLPVRAGAPDGRVPGFGRVLIIVENLSVPFDRRVWMEATALRRSGYDVTVICPQGSAAEPRAECIDGVRIHRHPLPSEGTSSAWSYLREYAQALRWELRLAHRVWREQGVDIVHICNPPDLLFLVAAWFRLVAGARVIFDQHDLSPEVYEAKFGRRGLYYYALRAAERLTFATAHAVIATNESYREIAIARGHKRPRSVFVVRSGPDASHIHPVEPCAAYRHGRPHLVGYLGVMGKQDGIDYLLRAIHHAVHRLGRTDIQYCLIGDGPALEEAKRLAAELSITEFVEFAGRIPWRDPELTARLSSCDVCVSPDPKNAFNDRSTMNKVLEYMALAKPIVQFDLMEGRRSASEASLYATPNDPVDFARRTLELIDAPARRARMGAIGRQRIEEMLAWRYQIPELLRAYAAAAERRRAPAGVRPLLARE